MSFLSGSSNVQARSKRLGLFPYKAEVDVPHYRASGDLTIMTSKRLDRHQDAQGLTWHCSHLACRHRAWESEDDLIDAHGDPARLETAGEVHIYYAYGHLPGISARDAVPDERDPKTGKIVKNGTRKVIGRAAQDAVFTNAE
jgi:hypothetical protein